MILAAKTIKKIIFVFIHSSRKIICHPNIDHPMRFVCEDIDVVLHMRE